MASQTKVDSAGRTAAERRAEGTPASYASDTSASGTFAAREGRANGSQRAAHPRDLVSDDLAGEAEPLVGASGEGEAEPQPVSGQAGHEAARASSIEELGARPAASAASVEDDEDVSLDELLISDSLDSEEDEDEATDIHPGLSEAVLAESLRAAPPVFARPSVPTLADAEDEQDVGTELAEPDVAVGDDLDVPEASAAEDEETPASVAARSAPLSEEPTAPDTSPAELLELAPESEIEPVSLEPVSLEPVSLEPLSLQPVSLQPVSSDADEAVASEAEAARNVEAAFEAEAALEAAEAALDAAEAAALESEEPVASAEIELEDSLETSEAPLAAAAAVSPERETAPEARAAKRSDGPLPSFDIPDMEAVSAASPAASAAPAERARATTRSLALPPLSEIDEEDDDDAVTHMGLPAVPEVANDYPASANSGFQVADPEVAALQSLDADISQGNSRRATTRVIPRVDPRSIPPKPRVEVPSGPPLGEQLGVMLSGAWARMVQFAQLGSAEPALDGELSPARRRVGWMVENVLPPLSLVLFGSGLGAGVIMMVEAGRAADAPAPSQAQAVQALHESPAPKGPLTLADRARAGDGDALYKITNLSQVERTSSLTLALEAGYQAQKLREFREFAKSLSAPVAPLPAASVSRMVDYATSPETMLAAFQELTQWAGPAGPDVLYAVWEKAAGGSRAASLAQQLLYSADQRAKATPALIVALDLRSAANCDDYLRVLPAVLREGDQRSSATLRALRHNDGCGADGQQDCYACLRDNTALEDALKAIETR